MKLICWIADCPIHRWSYILWLCPWLLNFDIDHINDVTILDSQCNVIGIVCCIYTFDVFGINDLPCVCSSLLSIVKLLSSCNRKPCVWHSMFLYIVCVYSLNVLVTSITSIWTIGHILKSTPTNGPRFTAHGLPWWSPIKVLTEVDVT